MEENTTPNSEQPVTPPSEFNIGTPSPLMADLNKLNESVYRVKNEIHKVIVGQENMIDLLLAGLFTNGHVILEGVPGIAKTLTAKLLAKTLSVNFSRIQFTPDLMPTDVVGTTVFNMKLSEFNFKQGPVFSNIVLIDEINRSPAKTQAALFEVMEERQITVDGVTYHLEFPFFVVATQNPIEQEGTYKLPEAQLDRFLFRIKMTYPTLENERDILKKFKNNFNFQNTGEVTSILNAADLQSIRTLIEKIHIKDELLDYIAQIIHNTRNNGNLFLGASPRASLAIMKTSKAIAAMRGREFVTPDDIKFVANPVLNHRIILSPEREMEGTETEQVIKEIIDKVEVPR